jgi:hypothetical protein
MFATRLSGAPYHAANDQADEAEWRRNAIGGPRWHDRPFIRGEAHAIPRASSKRRYTIGCGPSSKSADSTDARETSGRLARRWRLGFRA